MNPSINKNNQKIKMLIILLFVVGAILSIVYSYRLNSRGFQGLFLDSSIENLVQENHKSAEEETVTPERLEDEIKKLISNFGKTLQEVYKNSAPEKVKKDIQEKYAPYVSKELLGAWMKDTATSPGREVSSPWPASIEVYQIFPAASSPDERHFFGRLIWEDSLGEAKEDLMDIRVIREDGRWVIARFQSMTSSKYDASLE